MGRQDESSKPQSDVVDPAPAAHPTRRQWFAGAAGAAVAGTALVADAALRPTPASALAGFVDTRTDQTVGGVKTFQSAPVIPSASLPQAAVAGLVADLAAKQATIQPGTFVPVAGDATRTGVLTLTPGAATKTPLKIVTDATPTVDQFQLIGPPRAPGAGNYRIIADRNLSLTTNAAILIQADVWGGTDHEVPPPMAQARPICLGIVSDVTGPSFFMRGNGVGSYEEFQNGSDQVVWELKTAPDSGASGVFLGIGDSPVATLTLSDIHDPANLTALVLRHSPASARLQIPSGGTLDISSNYRSGENRLTEWAITMGHGLGIQFLTAAAPGGTRTLLGQFDSTGLTVPTGKKLSLGDGNHYLQWDGSSSRFGILNGDFAFTNGSEYPIYIKANSGNLGFRTENQFGAGVGVVGLANAKAPPSVNPTGGGVLYAEGGALKWRGSGGTVTILGAA